MARKHRPGAPCDRLLRRLAAKENGSRRLDDRLREPIAAEVVPRTGDVQERDQRSERIDLSVERARHDLDVRALQDQVGQLLKQPIDFVAACRACADCETIARPAWRNRGIVDLARMKKGTEASDQRANVFRAAEVRQVNNAFSKRRRSSTTESSAGSGRALKMGSA